MTARTDLRRRAPHSSSSPGPRLGEPKQPCERGSTALRDASLEPGPRTSNQSLYLVLCFAAFLPYANTLLNSFVYDDDTQVLNNPYIQSFSHLRDIFATTVWSYVGPQGASNYYRPVMTAGYLLCFKLFGGLAYGFHLANLVLHVAVVCLLFLLTQKLGAGRGWAFATAAVFALHPIHTESVAWIAAVTDIELTFFCLLTFWFLVNAGEGTRREREWARLGMVASFALALLSKEQALMFPALAAIYEHTCRPDRKATATGEKLARYGALWLVALAYVLFRVRFLGSFVPVQSRSSLSWPGAFFSALALIGEYLGKLLWPVRLCAFYVFSPARSLLEPRVIAGVAALAALALLFAFFWKRARLALFGVIWLVVTLGPVLNARWMPWNVFAERYLYLPSVGFAWVAGWALARLGRAVVVRSGALRTAFAAACVVLALGAAVRIIARNRDWRNDVTLYTRTLAQSPGAYPIHNNLGTTYWRQGRVEDAERQWRAALAESPENAIVLNNLGLVMTQRKRYAEALALFHRAILAKPSYSDPHLNLGIACRELHANRVAEMQLRAAVALAPLNVTAHNELGRLYLDERRLDEARDQFLQSVRSEPNNLGYRGLGEVDLRRGDRAAARQALERALAVDPYDSQAHFALAALDAATGMASPALREYQAGLATDPRNRKALAAVSQLEALVGRRKRSPAIHGASARPF